MSVLTASLTKGVVRSAVLLLLLISGPAAYSASGQDTVSGYPRATALRLGEAMYQKGVLPSGAPLQALVQGDIELSGAMTTCANCHLKSGLGSIEGGVLTPPTNGAKLYAPLASSSDIPGSLMKRSAFKTPRPAYTDATLTDVLINGVGPAGNRLSETMPRYLLDRDAASILISYLKQLTSDVSPGVSGDEIRFATIVSSGIKHSDRDSLVVPLKAYVQDEWNARLRDQLKLQNTNDPSRRSAIAFRKIVLDVWELTGPPDTWTRQLDAHYGKSPVFAILGGLVNGPWAPIHTFCEKNKIPSIFPTTELPVVSESDWYTLYFSKGLYQEGEAAAKYLSRVVELPADKRIIQVYRNRPEGVALAQGFSDTWKKLGNSPMKTRVVSAKEKTGPSFWKKLAKKYPNAVILSWLGPEDLTGIEVLPSGNKNRPVVFVSATMLDGAFSAIPESVRDFTFMTYPTRLPEESAYTQSLVTGWNAYKKLSITNMRISSNTFLITSLLSKVMIEMGNDTYRDYFLDVWDSGKDETNASANYPVLSFGPGQRYASKGCYVVSFAKGLNPKIVRQSEWIIY